MKKLNNKGFTLMELIIVIAIIAVLMLILVPTMGGFVDSAKKEALTANAKAAYTAAVAQNTAHQAELDPAKDAYEVTDEMNCDDLHPDFYQMNSSDSCVIEFNETTKKVVSVTYTSSDGDSAVYPKK